MGFNVGTNTPPTLADPNFEPVRNNILQEKINIDPTIIYFIPSEETLKSFLVINRTGIINILDRKNLQKAKIEGEQYWDKIFPLVQESPHVAIVINNAIYRKVLERLINMLFQYWKNDNYYIRNTGGFISSIGLVCTACNACISILRVFIG